MKVLLVEENSAVRSVVRQLVMSPGTWIQECVNAADAVAAYAASRPDCVIMGIGTKDPDGIAVSRQIKEMDPAARIVLVSDYDDAAMRESGIDPATTRQTLRVEIMKQAVIQQEVDRKIFFGLTVDELKKYFEAHQDKFRKPENVTLSEIFLSSAGKNEAEVKAKALQLVAQLRAGADFGATAVANSEREANGVRVALQTKGKVGAFQ